jgi:hypothetical protein
MAREELKWQNIDADDARDSRFPVRHSRVQDCVTTAIRSIDTARVHHAAQRRFGINFSGVCRAGSALREGSTQARGKMVTPVPVALEFYLKRSIQHRRPAE